MRKLAVVFVLFLAAWTLSSYALYTPEHADVVTDNVLYDVKVDSSTTTIVVLTADNATTSTHSALLSTSTSSTTVSDTPVAKNYPGTPYFDSVAPFSLIIPIGWTSKPDTDTGSSTRIVDFAPISEMHKESPEPLVFVSFEDFTQIDEVNFESNKEQSDLIVQLGSDGFVNWTIDNVFKKEFNAFEIQSLVKKNINGKTFYVIDAKYISEKSYKDVRFVTYMYVTKDKVVAISTYTFEENWVRFKSTVLGLMNSFKI
jgi:hypothetical protein